MSSLMVVQEQRQMIFAVDTAHSSILCDLKTGKSMISRYRDEEADKIYNVGKDACFISGMNYVTDPVTEKLNEFLDKKNHVNIELLKQYLQKNYPYSQCPVKEYGFSDIGVAILQVINNEAIITKLDQYEGFEPKSTKAKQGEVKLSVDGFDNKRIYENGNKFLNRLSNFGWRTPEALITIYQNNYSEGVGNSIRVYKFDWSGCNLIKEAKLIEKDLRYINIDENGNESVDADKVEYSAHLNACSGTFTGTVQAGQVIGGTVEGATINGSTINGTVINGCTINGGEFNSENPTLGRLNIEGAYIMGWDKEGNNDLNLSSDGNLQCQTVGCTVMNCSSGYMNGNLLINARNKDSYTFRPESHSHSSLEIIPIPTTSGNIDFSGGVNAASVTYVQDNFERKSSSDFRLKKNIRSLDELPDDLYYSLKPKLFEFKCEPYKLNVSNIGLLAQEVVSAFKHYSLDAFQYGIVEYANVRSYSDESLYITDGKLLRINYDQLISWGILINQKLYKQNTELTDRVLKLEKIVSQLVGSEG